jgi:ankyrin repeat protein
MCTVSNMMVAIPGHKRRRSSSSVVPILSASFESEAGASVENEMEEMLPKQPQHKKPRTMQEISNVLHTITPSSYARAAFKANGFDTEKLQAQAISKFESPTNEMIDSHRTEVVCAVRRNDLDAIRKMHQEGTLKGNACNKFGESILHIACHRGHTALVKYMLEDMKINVQSVRDDYQRTALHDACWTTEPAFDVVDILLDVAPEHVLLKDARGFLPFDYVRKQDHGKWLRFLWERKHKLRPTKKNC